MSAARDLTPLPDLLHGTPAAGPVRTRRPVYVDLLPPCNHACPAGENIQAWLQAVRDGDFEKAGHGTKAARCIDAYLSGSLPVYRAKNDLAEYALLHPWYFADNPALAESERPVASRLTDFGEVVAGLASEEAVFEAGRCLSCGSCFECDGCLGACPEDAVIKLGRGHRYRFDYDRCTGCGTCYEQCPVGSAGLSAARWARRPAWRRMPTWRPTCWPAPTW